jgi:sulfide dehydrogenase [flavocytochrome c] flavoprotein chain
VSVAEEGQEAISPPPGRLLASNCFQCHGPNEASPGFDKLTGKPASKLYKELKEFQSGGEGENIMAYHAGGFTDVQLRSGYPRSLERREMNRRDFFLSSLSAAIAALPRSSWARTAGTHKARVTVVGGGMAGATVAKYLRLWDDKVDVTLIERRPKYPSNILSSLVLTGQRTMASLSFGYEALRDRYGVQVIFDEVVEVDPMAVSVKLAAGSVLRADRIVLAPGIEFDPVPGQADPRRMPHAWEAGPQTTLLAQQLADMPDQGTFVLTIPKAPYRCPPGPCERACLIADWLKEKKPGAKVIIVDANPDIVAEKENFSKAFTGLYANIIEYRNGVEISSVDTDQMTLSTNAGTIRGDVINLIPKQRASTLAAKAGLVTESRGGFASVDVLSYASTIAPNVHVIGDSYATAQPKAGHIANQEAKVCAVL